MKYVKCTGWPTDNNWPWGICGRCGNKFYGSTVCRRCYK